MEMERRTFPEALKQLAEQAGVTLPERDAHKPSLTKRLYEVNEAAVRFFQQSLSSPPGEKARSYLRERQFDSTAIELFQLGFAPEGRESLVRNLRSAGFDDHLLLTAGLALQDEQSHTFRDRFHGRLMFPIRDASKRVVGFGGRILSDGQPKYLNSPQTEIFDKSSVLFGVHLAQDAIRQAKRAVLVEGYLDAVRAHVSGFQNVVASLGTAVTLAQLRALHRFTGVVVLALDPDAAGKLAAARAGLNALAELTPGSGRSRGDAGALDLRIAVFPPGQGDPDEMIRDQPAIWKESLSASVPAFEFYFTQTMQSLDRDDPTWRQQALDRLLPVLQKLAGSADWQASALQRLASETGISTQLLINSLPRMRPPTSGARPRAGREQARASIASVTTDSLAADPALGIERALMALLLKLVVVPPSIISGLTETPFVQPDHEQILGRLLDWSPGGNYDYMLFRETLPDELRDEADALHARDVPVPEDDKLELAVSLHVARWREFRLQARLDTVQQLLTEVGPEDLPAVLAQASELLAEIGEVDQTLERLNLRAVQSGMLVLSQGTIDHDSGSR
jgi:DNA primase catalytic core